MGELGGQLEAEATSEDRPPIWDLTIYDPPTIDEQNRNECRYGAENDGLGLGD